MQRPGKIKNVKKIHAIARKVLLHGIRNFVWASGNGRGEVGGSRKKFSVKEESAEGQVKLLRARRSAELGKIASGSATQGLWLRDRKLGSQVIDEDRSRLPGRETVGEVMIGGR